MVLATQNPLEQSGTYSLPEAQLDRFLLKTIVDYPSKEEELEIMKQYSQNISIQLQKVFSSEEIKDVRSEIENIQVSESIYQYVADIVFLTRQSDFTNKYLAI
jgi:MoxR-like ATPase